MAPYFLGLRSFITIAAVALICGPAARGLAQDAPPPEEQPPAEGAPPAEGGTEDLVAPEPQPAPTEPPPPSQPAPQPAPTVEPAPSAEPEPYDSGPREVVVRVDRGDDEEEEEEEEAEPPPRNPFDPHEAVGDKLYHFGVFARGIFVPQYGQNFFVQGGNNALRPSAGAFFNYRQDNLNFMIEVSWANFFNTAAYRGLNEPDDAMEWIESELSVLFVNLVMMYSIPLTSWLAFEIGGAIGLGGVFGGLWRTEAYPDATADAGWTPCSRPGDPRDVSGRYCDAAVEQGGEGSYQRLYGEPEPYNFEGGVPPLWFWLELPRIAIRIKPIRQLQIRAEAGFAVYGFEFGASLALGL